MTCPESRTATIRTLLSEDRTEYNRAMLSEVGINFLREYADHKGWDRNTLATFLRESLMRAKRNGCTADLDGLAKFKRNANAKPGSVLYTVPGQRSARIAAFAQLAGRGLI